MTNSIVRCSDLCLCRYGHDDSDGLVLDPQEVINWVSTHDGMNSCDPEASVTASKIAMAKLKHRGEWSVDWQWENWTGWLTELQTS